MLGLGWRGCKSVNVWLHGPQVVGRRGAYVPYLLGSQILNFEVVLNAVSKGDVSGEVFCGLPCFRGANPSFQDDIVMLDSDTDMKLSLLPQMPADGRGEFWVLHDGLL
jgi:hypothetical protein